MRYLAACLVIASFAFAEDAAPPNADAEALLLKLEAKIASAKTVSIRIAMEVAQGDEKQAFEVAIDFKEGNRARLEVNGKGEDGKTSFTLTSSCDGKRLANSDPDGTEVTDAAADLSTNARALAIRAPIKDLSKTMGGSAPKAAMTYSDFAFAADEKLGDRAARVVTCVASRGSNRLEMKFWIDGEKLVLLKRETVEKKKGIVTTRAIDTFSGMTFDAEIKDETFAVPEQKGGK